MTIIVPADPYETKMMNKLVDFHGPVYIRVGRNRFLKFITMIILIMKLAKLK